jgi:hypothetical protein
MTAHVFTLQVTNIQADRTEDALFEAGCDDALVAVVDEAMFLDFDREAPSLGEAIESAVHNVEQAGGRVVRIDRSGR